MKVVFRFPYSDKIIECWAEFFSEMSELIEKEVYGKQDFMDAFYGKVEEVWNMGDYGECVCAKKGYMEYFTSRGNSWKLVLSDGELFVIYEGSRHGFWAGKNNFNIDVVKEDGDVVLRMCGVKGVLVDYETSTPGDWGIKWYEKAFRDHDTGDLVFYDPFTGKKRVIKNK